MRCTRRLALVALVGLLGGCKQDSTFHDAGVHDAEQIDAEVAPIDAPPPLPAYEITGGARGLAGKRFQADVQIGHGVGQAPASAGTTTVEGNAAVKP